MMRISSSGDASAPDVSQSTTCAASQGAMVAFACISVRSAAATTVVEDDDAIRLTRGKTTTAGEEDCSFFWKEEEGNEEIFVFFFVADVDDRGVVVVVDGDIIIVEGAIWYLFSLAFNDEFWRQNSPNIFANL
jgi:hypothetical protein